MPDDEDDGRRFADLISEPEGVKDLREYIKSLAKAARDRGEEATIDDFLAQSRKNDAAYIAPADLKKADCPYIRPRGPSRDPPMELYRILGRGYERPNSEPYTASNSSWTELKEVFKWARIIGLVDFLRVQDAANPDSKPTAFDDVDNPLTTKGVTATREAVDSVAVDDGFLHASIPREIELAECVFEDAEEFIETAAKMIADQTFKRLISDAAAEQHYYIEIWAKKSGVIPDDLAAEYGATIRESGKGDFSLSMCEAAVESPKRGIRILLSCWSLTMIQKAAIWILVSAEKQRLLVR